MESKSIQALKEARKRGYYINEVGEVYDPKGNQLKGSFAKIGYRKFSYRINKETFPVFYHRLQAYQKYGEEMFKDGICVRHLDSDKTNNCKNNIVIGSISDNMMDKPKKVRQVSALKAARIKQNSNRSLSKRHQIYQWLHEGKSYNWIIENSDATSKGTLSYMKNKSIEYKEYIKNLA